MTHPPIRSYVLRQGRFSPGQQRAYAELLPKLGVPYRPEPLNFPEIFGRVAPVVVEIGSGMGETTARIALENPAVDYLAVEVHAPGVGSLLKHVEENGAKVQWNRGIRDAELRQQLLVRALLATREAALAKDIAADRRVCHGRNRKIGLRL